MGRSREQNMPVEISGLTPNNDFPLFVTPHAGHPFGPSRE